jgi:Tol biopolymer transport system component/DNA-binding winged helix-turn-helix (wHTH) protein
MAWIKIASSKAGKRRMQGKLFRFGLFELNDRARQLYKQGRRVRLQDQPLRVLEILLERPGELVTRQELRDRLWGSDIFVDFELGLNGAIKRLRLALGDSADNPRFVETVTKSGYRFIAPVQAIDAATEVSPSQAASGPQGTSNFPVPAKSAPATSPVTAAPAATAWSGKKKALYFALSVSVAAILFCAAAYLRPLAPSLLVVHIGRLSNSGHAWSGENLMSDGARLYYSEYVVGKGYLLRQILLNGNEDMPVAGLPANLLIRGLTPDHTTFLAISRTEAEKSSPSPLWMTPVVGGQPRRIGSVLATDAVYSPDGSSLAFARDHQLFVAAADGTGERLLANAPGHIFCPRWSPDGSRIRYTVSDPRSRVAIWEIKPDGGNLHPLDFNWPGGPMEGYGDWTADGRYYVFTSQRGGISNLWAIEDKVDWLHRARPQPVQLTAGPIQYFRPLPSADGTRIFAVGSQSGGELLRYDPAKKVFVPFLDGRSADQLDFSRDGRSLAFVQYPEATLWRARSDGTGALQLTFPPLRSTNPRWSPDGKRILFVGWRTGEMPKLYTIPFEGGGPEALLGDVHAQTSATWSPDGRFVFYGRDPYDEKQDMALYRIDTKTGHAEKVPGTSGLYAPLCSPDGRRLITQTTESDERLVLFDLKTSQASTVSKRKGDYPAWSPDSRYVYFNTLIGNGAIFRIHLPDGREEKVIDVPFATTGVFGRWSGLAPDGSILVLRDRRQSDVYALSVKKDK